jgi:FHS family L-fucose permease-like MFS transporter
MDSELVPTGCKGREAVTVQLSSNQPRTSGEAKPEDFTAPLTLMMVLYFGIGFVTALNDVLVPNFKDLFHLTNVMALLVQFAFFGAYFVMSLPSGRLIVLLGYQRSISVALFIMGAGLLLFVPASYFARYWILLGALFVVGSGLALLQVAINPYLGAIGNPEKINES